jgi:hypothetical protein
MIALDWKKHLVFIHPTITESSFLDMVGVVPGSYAGDLFSRIYSYVIGSSSDLQLMYDKYYREEYATFEEYLLKKERLPSDLIPIVREKIAARCSVSIMNPIIFGDFGIPQLLEGEESKWIFDLLCGVTK